MKETPTYYTKYSPERNYEDFLNFVENHIMLDETENPQKGSDYIEKANPTFPEMFKNIELFGSDILLALTLLAKEENISEKEIAEMLKSASSIEPVSGSGGDNFAFKTPIERELSVDLNSFKGKLDGEIKTNIYKALKEKLDPKTAQKIEDMRHYVENDVLFYRIPQYFWALYVDEEKFKNMLVDKLKMTEEQIEQLTKVA